MPNYVAMRTAADVLRARYRALHRDVMVEHEGRAGEHGIDVLATIPDPLGAVLRVGIRVERPDLLVFMLPRG